MTFKIPTVLMANEIIDKSLRKASKIEEPYNPIFEEKVRRENISRVAAIEGSACSHLDRLVKKFPGIERIHPFYEDLIDLSYGKDAYKESLSRVMWASNKIKNLATESIRSIKKKRKAFQIVDERKKFYGRFCSVIEGIDKELIMLNSCRDFIRKLPEIDPEEWAFIISGLPNVGKSSLLSALSGTDEKVAPYPFTTQNVRIGHIQIGYQKVQLIDTPGILDRPMAERNEMERKAILCLKDIKGSIFFLIDHSGTSGYSIDEQENLYSEIKANFMKHIIRIQTKSDISEKKENIAISATNYTGIDELLKVMENEIHGNQSTY
ncbi:MAG: NOG1 family protein [Thermoplasmataceae archaeon]